MAGIKSLILFTILGCVAAYRHGAPASACASLTPRHGHHRPQTKDAPYELLLTRDTTTPLWTIEVTLKTKNEDDSFLGFLAQARSDDDKPIGKFTVLREFRDISQLLTCENSGDSITHREINDEVNEVSFQWTAPSNFTSPFRFHYTVARDKHIFWADITKDVEFRGADNLV